MRLKSTSRLLALAAAAFLAGVPAEAYYHYTYYFNGNGGNPIRAHFSLGGSNTVTFFVNDAGPANYASGDTFGSLLAEVRQAIAAWNQVSSSQLKLAFGGLEDFPQTENTPGADITFLDLPPGLLGYASPNLPATPPNQLPADANGQYIPIVRSTVVLTSNTGQAPGPTYTEGFFTTAVHEMGHALGLQHTWTGAAMSQSVVRNTNRARPIDADDIAALSVLYGAPGWAANYGSISGRVTFNNGAPVSMASVVALPVNGPAVSALTNPDGSYTINGLPTNTYLLYVHPLPPDAVPGNGEGLLLPENQNGATATQPSGAFQTVFYPGTLNPNPANATTFSVNAGSTFTTANFSVVPEAAVPLYEVDTTSYIDPGARAYTVAPPNPYITISPAFVNPTQGLMLVAAGANSGSMPAPQSVTILGGFAAAPSCASTGNKSPCFTTSGAWLFAYFNPPLAAGIGPRHMVFNLGNDIYVLPDAVTLVQNSPPYVNSVVSNADGTATVTGTGFAPDTMIYFDGLEVPGTFNPGAGSITVTPPAGNSGQTSIVAAYTSDGQNSEFLQYPGSPASNPQLYTFPFSGSTTITANPPALPTASAPTGFSAMVSIAGSNTDFMNGQVTVGFGTTDITVSRVWVVSPTQVVANVVVAPNAAIGSSEISVISGFQVITQPFGFQIQPPNAAPVISAVINAAATEATIFPGAYVSIYGANLANTPASAQITLSPAAAPAQSTAIPVLFSTGGQINFQVPANFPTGPALLNLSNGPGTVTIVVPIALAPPVILSIVNSNNATVDATHAANPGDFLTIQVNGLDSTVAANPSRLQVTVGGLSMPVLSINGSQIQFEENHSFGGVTEPVVVVVDGSASSAYTILSR